jgi:pimeloyl-ACP methyl ester carboxylesterase
MNTTNIARQRGAELVNANGAEIAYVDIGDGPPLVLLHGALVSTGPAWAGSGVAHVDHFATLGKSFRVIAPDTRGSGATPHAAGPAGFDMLAADVIALIEALELDRPFVAGFSEGGATATLVTLRRPDLVRGLINHAGFDYFDPVAMAEQHDRALRPLFGGRPGATQADPDAADQASRSIPGLDAVFATMKVDYDSAQGEGHWRTYLGQFFDRSVAPLGHTVADLATIAAPTLILAGDRDMFCTVEAACHVYRTAPNAELAVIPNCGHEITTSIIDTMGDFLSRHVDG